MPAYCTRRSNLLLTTVFLRCRTCTQCRDNQCTTRVSLCSTVTLSHNLQRWRKPATQSTLSRRTSRLPISSLLLSRRLAGHSDVAEERAQARLFGFQPHTLHRFRSSMDRRRRPITCRSSCASRRSASLATDKSTFGASPDSIRTRAPLRGRASSQGSPTSWSQLSLLCSR